jgi:hypothetical protein
MATTSLHYLCMKVPPGDGPCGNVLEMETRLRNRPFLAYAAHHWGQHTRREEEALRPLIHKLLDNAGLRASSYQVLQHRTRLDSHLAEVAFSALPTGLEPLYIVAYWDLGTTAELYLDEHTLSLVDPQGWTPLHWACFKRSATIRELLLRRRVPVDPRDLHGWTPLFWVSFNGDVEALVCLLDRGADHLVNDMYSWTILQWAVFSGQRSAVEVLLNHHASFLAREAKRPPVTVALLSLPDTRRLLGARRLPSMVPAELVADSGDADLLDMLLQGISPNGGKTSGFNEA